MSALAAPGRHLDWLLVVAFSWVLPLVAVQHVQYEYAASLAFWLIPIVILARRFRQLAQPDPTSGVPYSRRWRAMIVSGLVIVVLGLVLDFVLGPHVLKFDLDTARQYLWVLWRGIPVEEVAFYVMAPTAILLVYAWCDEVLVPLATPRPRLGAADFLVRLSPPLVLAAAGLVAGGIAVKWGLNRTGPLLPVYFCYLVAVAFLPAIMLYRWVNRVVNWAAFTATTLYVVATSVIWEATLAIPRRWWGYQGQTALGIFVPDWSRDGAWPFPLEAALVWGCAPFSCVLTYEAARALLSGANPSMARRIHPNAARAADALTSALRRLPRAKRGRVEAS